MYIYSIHNEIYFSKTKRHFVTIFGSVQCLGAHTETVFCQTKCSQPHIRFHVTRTLTNLTHLPNTSNP